MTINTHTFQPLTVETLDAVEVSCGSKNGTSAVTCFGSRGSQVRISPHRPTIHNIAEYGNTAWRRCGQIRWLTLFTSVEVFGETKVDTASFSNVRC
jgi:hypothetical protein